MELFITDNLKAYNDSTCNYKILYGGSVVVQWNLTSSIDEFNLGLSGIEYKAADAMHHELSECITILDKYSLTHNKYLATRGTKSDIHFSLLYNSYWQLVIKKQVLRIVIEKLLALISQPVKQINLLLDESFSLAAVDFEKYFASQELNFNFSKNPVSLKKQLLASVKNLGYTGFYTWKKITGYNIRNEVGKKQVLLVIYDVPSLHVVLEKFYTLVNSQESIHLTILALTSGISQQKAIDAFKYSGKSISVIDYTQFRKGNFINHTDLYHALESLNEAYSIVRKQQLIENLETHYSWLGNAFEQLKPDVCFTLGVLEISRAISDVARFYKVPSINVDYGLFTDDSLFMASNIKFDIRACISKMNADIWKRHKDPSTQHQVIGFCKLDSYTTYTQTKVDLLSKYGFNATATSIFFASSWASSNKSYNLEKQKIVKELALLCSKNNWNLIIKKHPAEVDDLVKQVIEELKFNNQKVFEHAELPLNDAIFMSDVCTTQSSSMVADTLYFEKPFCFLAGSDVKAVTDLYSEFKKDGSIETFASMQDFETFVTNITNEVYRKTWQDKILALKEKYLFKTDGKASERLLHLLATTNASKG
jgi:hypothetical protein